MMGPWSWTAPVSATSYRWFCRGKHIKGILLGLWELKLFFPPFVSIYIGAEIPEKAYILSLVLISKSQFC